MNEFQKRALAYNAYRALRKAASKGNLGELLKHAEGDGTREPVDGDTLEQPKSSPGLKFKRGFAGIFPKGPRGKSPRPKGRKKGCC